MGRGSGKGKKAMKIPILIAALALIISGCQKSDLAREGKRDMAGEVSTIRQATFAGGCFWCVEADFEKHPGVVNVLSGYTGGLKENPSYEEVSSGTTGHVEAVQVYAILVA